MDDIANGTDNTPQGQALHEHIVHQFLDILERHSYFLKVSKCEFEKREIEFLGFLVGGISDLPRELKSVKEVRQILRVLGYQ